MPSVMLRYMCSVASERLCQLRVASSVRVGISTLVASQYLISDPESVGWVSSLGADS